MTNFLKKLLSFFSSKKKTEETSVELDPEDSAFLLEIAKRAYGTGNIVRGTVDENGNRTITELPKS